MKTQQTLLRAAVTGLISIGAAAFATSAFADGPHGNQEQCAGVIKAAKNDCATATNACHGHVNTDGDPMAWIYLPKGTCERIVGARIVKVTDPTPQKS